MERDWRPFIYGGLASCVAEFGTFPIDTTKTRLQVQGQKHDVKFSTLKYNGMIDCIVKVTRQEGFLALYSGIWPAVVRQATYGTIKFGTYYSLKRHLLNRHHFTETVHLNMSCAVAAGAISSAIACPTDVLKVRMQVAGTAAISETSVGPAGTLLAANAAASKFGAAGTMDVGKLNKASIPSNNSLVGCFLSIWRTEGVAGLWRGVNPTAQRAAVIAAVELPVYDWCKQRLLSVFGDRISNHFISSVIASLGSAIASTPIDVVRTRLMNQKRLKPGAAGALAAHAHAHLYTGTIDCFIRTVRHEGFWALYKGFVPTWVRMGPWNVIFFITYEQLKLIY